MAPSRRKGASKAAAAAAACRQWKVGDLVLAKVKGFPAWPATVSEPEKWGYSTDWKKVLVFFFGTQQIAFCNPADVEAFTEEKKESLLSKRHGKGADFVRAVREIIDSYEELKKQEYVDHVNTNGQQATLPNGVSEERVASPVLKDESHTPAPESVSKLSDSGIPGEDTRCKDPSGNLVLNKAHLSTTYSRKKYSGGRASVMHKRPPSARRPRSSARVESCSFPKPSVPSDGVERNSTDLSRRTKRARTSTDLSDGPDKDPPLEENSSEIVSVDSDTRSFNEDVSVQCGYKFMEPECVGGDLQLSQTLEFQTKTVIVRKKRKPSRKRAITVTKFDKQSVSCSVKNKTEPIESNGFKNPIGISSNEDGDEHLPLVKRARVRMGQTSSSREELDTVMEIIKHSEALNNLPGQQCIVLSDGEDICAERKLNASEEELDQPSSFGKYVANKPLLWESNRHKHFGGLADGEAALPPSKRLHRALEAMSANVVEDQHVFPQGSSSMNTIINGSFSLLKDYSNLAIESNVKPEFEAKKVDSLSNIGSLVHTSVVPSNVVLPVEQNNAVEEVNAGSLLEHELSEDAVVKSVECANGKDSVMSPPCTKTVETVMFLQNPKPFSDATENKDSLPECNHTLVTPIVSLKTEVEVECSDLLKSSKRDHSEVSGVSSNPVSSNVENGIVAHDDVNLTVHCSLPEICNIEDHQFDEGENDNAILKDIQGTNHSNTEVDASPSLTTMEILKKSAPGPQLSHSTYVSEDCMNHKTVSGTRTSSSPTDGLDSTARASPPTTSICNISTSDNSNFIENNGSCSPGIALHHEKTKPDGRWSVVSEANAALTCFEASLGTLTRTKKTIDRATRIAIDCARFGVAVKVIEIIARNLEAEPSLHKRVDLFFLVDSIAQCSRGMKGDVGGLYPSAIQAVLPRLLLASAPPGSCALENRRQCLKVLKLWQERKILPEPMICHHIRELDSLNNMSSKSGSSRRSFRNERAFDDPVREVEGMLVDEYGSNSSIQLSDLRMPTMVKDESEQSDSDGEGFEAVTPERDPEVPEENDGVPTPSAKKHTHVLEDVDGELEMEDVAPSSAASETKATTHIQLTKIGPNLPSFAPPLPKDLPPSSPPLPNSPPPLPPVSLPLPPPPPPAAALPDPIYAGPPNGNDDHDMDVQVSESSTSCSFSSLPANNVHLRPPHPPVPSSQFSYVQADQSWREIPPPSYPARFRFVNATDSANFQSDHDRMYASPHDDSWRFPPPPFSGPCHPDGPRGPYTPNTFAGPPCEPPVSNNPWPYPRNHRPFSESPLPMATRGPNFWRPR